PPSPRAFTTTPPRDTTVYPTFNPSEPVIQYLIRKSINAATIPSTSSEMPPKKAAAAAAQKKVAAPASHPSYRGSFTALPLLAPLSHCVADGCELVARMR
ncbi:MAG: hypothetical protein L6R36_009477, partial [Xanthoria steineri]